jgi:8-oxo-dGTP pyrophosphatase MutT (NUDIX family)
MTGRKGAAVIVARAGRVLAISRGHDVSNWGLPGGGLEPGETYYQGAVRELWEETGVDAQDAMLVPVLQRQSARGRSVIFWARGPVVLPAELRSRPFEGYVAWLRPGELLSPRCEYREPNALALSRVGLL